MTLSFDVIQNLLPSDVTPVEIDEIKVMLQQRLAELTAEEQRRNVSSFGGPCQGQGQRSQAAQTRGAFTPEFDKAVELSLLEADT